MELGFLTSAIRRYWPVILIFALLGGTAAWLRGGDDELYRSRGVLIVRPPADVAANYAGDQDRYVLSQLSVLRSDNMAERVATSLAETDDTTAAVVSSVVAFKHETDTDIIEVVVETGDAEFSQRIANAYLNGYIADIDEQIKTAVDPIDDLIDAVREELATTDAAIQEAIEPFITAEPPTDGSPPPIPTADQVVPSLATQRDLLLARLTGLETNKAQLEANHSQTATIVQRATLPALPVTDSGTLLVAAGVFGGGFVGFLAAVLRARLSPRVLDDLQAAEILGQPIIGAFPADKIIARDRRAALEEPPPSIIGFVESLCVQVESNAQRAESSLTVVVVGTQRLAGTTTLASALANQFAANGSSVLLVDADQRHPQLTTLFGNPEPDDPAQRGPRRSPTGKFVAGPKLLHRHNSTIVPNLRVASFSGGSILTAMRRQQVGSAVDESAAQADVVVFDGGPLMAASATVQLSRLCDAVIVAMPPRQHVKPLGIVAGTLRARPFLTVSTPAGRRSLGQRLARLVPRRRQRTQFDEVAYQEDFLADHRDDSVTPRHEPQAAVATADGGGDGPHEEHDLRDEHGLAEVASGRASTPFDERRA